MMADILKPTRGSITTDGRISALLELGAGFHPDLTGRENIYLNAAILGLRRAEVDKIFDDIVEFSGLERVHRLAGAATTRAACTCASASPWRCTSTPRSSSSTRSSRWATRSSSAAASSTSTSCATTGVTIVMVTHSLNLVRQMCDRAAWLDHGVLMAEGKAADVVHEYVDKVDAAENERLEAADKVKAELDAEFADAARPVAVTQRPIVLGEVEALDGDLRSSRLFHTFEPMTVRVHYQCKQPIEDPLFSMTVESQAGVLVAWPGMQPNHRAG